MATQQQRITTYADMIDHLIRYTSMDPSKQSLADARKAVLNGYNEFCNSRNWSFLYARGRVTTVGPYSTGSIAYDDTSRQITLTGGTWPAWAGFADIRINNIPYQVASRDSDTQLTLSRRTTVGSNLSAGTVYLLYRDRYPLPVDFGSSYDWIEYNSGYQCSFSPNANLLFVGRIGVRGPAKPLIYSVMADPYHLGGMAAWLHPIPDSAWCFDFIYRRRPRYLANPEYSVGSATVAAATAAVTGNATSWLDRHVGSIIRFGAAGDKAPPSGLTGDYPYTYERTIVAVTNGQALTIDEAIPEDMTNRPYRISDPIDIEDGACMTAFHRECEKQMRLVRRMKPLYDGDASEQKEWNLAYLRAMEADKRGLSAQIVGGGVAYRRRLADMPISFNA